MNSFKRTLGTCISEVRLLNQYLQGSSTPQGGTGYNADLTGGQNRISSANAEFAELCRTIHKVFFDAELFFRLLRPRRTCCT